MDNGDLVPDQVTIDMLKITVAENPNVNGFIFDGFPRTRAQAEALDTFLSKKSMAITATIALEAEDDVLVKRLINRGITSGRSDDQNEVKIINRFEEYKRKTSPLKSFYKNQGKFYSINGIGNVEEITERLTKLINSLL